MPLVSGKSKQTTYRSADKSLARPGRKHARKHVRNARDFNNIETRAIIKAFLFCKASRRRKIHVILTEKLACFLPGRAKDLTAPLKHKASVGCNKILHKTHNYSRRRIERAIVT